jgi:hypothetical protein
MSFFAKLAHQISANAGEALPRTFLVSVARVEDVVELVESMRGYQIKFMQLDRGPFAAELVQTQLSGVLLTAAQYGRSLGHSAGPPSRNLRGWYHSITGPLARAGVWPS